MFKIFNRKFWEKINLREIFASQTLPDSKDTLSSNCRLVEDSRSTSGREDNYRTENFRPREYRGFHRGG